MNKPELILPGGDLSRVKIAFQYGADAVYVGLNEYSLRKAEVRFDLVEIKMAIAYAHKLGKRLFVTFNILAHNNQLKNLKLCLYEIAQDKPDAFIIADPGIIAMAKSIAPGIPIHLSTQATTLNTESVKFWQNQGIKRIILARELTLEEIKEIHCTVPKMELEIFVHGAMCISYSGRCLLSNYMIGRNANLGNCAQPCRWDYQLYLEERMRPGELYPISEDKESTMIMSSKDLRLIRYLPDILEAGVTNLKIEGRNKSEYYLATTAKAYRDALGLIKSGKYTARDKKALEEETEKLNYRDYTTGFLFGDAKLGEIAENRSSKSKWQYVGIICDDNNTIIVKNKIRVGDKIEIMTPKGLYQDRVLALYDLLNNELEEINPGPKDHQAVVSLSKTYQINSILRKKL